MAGDRRRTRAGLGTGMLAGLAVEAGAAELSLDLIAGLGDLESASPAQALWNLSRQVKASPALSALFDEGAGAAWRALQEKRTGDLAGFGAAFDEFLARYGCRGPNEWDLYTKSWEVDSTQPLGMVVSMRHSPDSEGPANRMRAQEERREAAGRRMRELLGGAPDKLAQFDAALASAALCITAREKTKLMCVLDLGEIRMAFLELGRRGVEAGLFSGPTDVMMLLAGELDAYLADPASFAPVIAERLETFRELYDIDPPFVLTADPPTLAEWPRKSRSRPGGSAPAAAETVLTGLGGSPGSYTGRSRIITGLDQAGRIEPGDVLVAPFTDAAWTPLFLVAGAVVVDLGAINSHAMVVARELGIPCVVSVQDATSSIPDGALVTVDGTAGTVTIMAPSAGDRVAAS